MPGDETVRHCQLCNLNVYNLSDMSEKEIYSLFRKKEGRLCIKIYKRRDGTLITDNCPRGLRAARNRLKIIVASIVAMLVTIGLMQAAQAQGLVGAPVDPRYGGSGEVGGQLGGDGTGYGLMLQNVNLARSVALAFSSLAIVGTIASPKWEARSGWGKIFFVLLLLLPPLLVGILGAFIMMNFGGLGCGRL
jgi:hypothetical protein